MSVPTEADVLNALRVVQDPDLHKDIVALGFVKGLRIDGGRVSFTIELTTPACPVKELLQGQARQAVSVLPGVTSVTIEMTASVRSARADGGKQPVEGVRNIIAVGAGKGGVGKTTVAVNIAAALAARGSRVAILDADFYGPNVPIMLGTKARIETDGKKMIPAERFGIQIMSVALLTEDDAAVVWRGPMLHTGVQQFCRDVRWDAVDYLIVDMPPGTGDVAISLAQTVPVSGAVLVTTPQTVSIADTRRAIQMYRKLNIPTLGLIENMSHFVCPGCGRESDIFGQGGGEALAAELMVPFLGRVPLHEPVRRAGDSGVPAVIGDPTSAASIALVAAAERVAQQVSIASFSRGVIPLEPVH